MRSSALAAGLREGIELLYTVLPQAALDGRHLEVRTELAVQFLLASQATAGT